MRQQNSIVIVTRPTRLDGLRRRWGTLGQAKFVMAAARAIESEMPGTLIPSDVHHKSSKAMPESDQVDFAEYSNEDSVYQNAIDELEFSLQFGIPIKTIDRAFVPNFNFSLASVVVVVGQDGLVANVAKYVGNVPIVAVNPDPTRIDGVLLPFLVSQVVDAVRAALSGSARIKSVTLAEAKLNDGQRLLAFNDFYIGAASHISARYLLTSGRSSEPQSSSGVLVCTGAGSTGWISSVFNMAAGVARFLGSDLTTPQPFSWDDRRLFWAVREPFQSRTSRIGMVAGCIEEPTELIIESLMPEHGVIFSDGIESDFLPFTSGSIVHIGVSQQQAYLVCP